jgi:hypothetical protein
MHASALKSETARRNGALSKGPATAAGKNRSRLNSLVHGRRAQILTEFVPPESALLSNEDRQKFFALFDQNLAKYQPADPAEKALVRELTEMQWANFRCNAARHTLLNRELRHHQDNFPPPEATAVAYESVQQFKTMAGLRHEYMANTRVIAQLERRLLLLQYAWPAETPATMDSQIDRTHAETSQPTETTHETPQSGPIELRVHGPLTRAVIAMYRKLHPNRDLSFTDM